MIDDFCCSNLFAFDFVGDLSHFNRSYYSDHKPSCGIKTEAQIIIFIAKSRLTLSSNTIAGKSNGENLLAVSC